MLAQLEDGTAEVALCFNLPTAPDGKDIGHRELGTSPFLEQTQRALWGFDSGAGLEGECNTDRMRPADQLTGEIGSV